MEKRAAFGRDRVLDREPRELVSEDDHAVALGEHPGAEALGEVLIRLAHERRQEPRLGTCGRHRDGLQYFEGARTQACCPSKDGVANRLGDAADLSRQHLRDIERVPDVSRYSSSGSASDGSASCATPVGERGSTRSRLAAADGREAAEDDPQWMPGSSSSSR